MPRVDWSYEDTYTSPIKRSVQALLISVVDIWNIFDASKTMNRGDLYEMIFLHWK